MSSLVIARLSMRSLSHGNIIASVRRCSSLKDGEHPFDASRPHPLIDKMIRVNHAGEFGATRIYAGQSSFTEKPSVRFTIEVHTSHFVLPITDNMYAHGMAFVTSSTTMQPVYSVRGGPHDKKGEGNPYVFPNIL